MTIAFDLTVGAAEGRGFQAEDVRGLAPLNFIARNLDSGGELRGEIKV